MEEFTNDTALHLFLKYGHSAASYIIETHLIGLGITKQREINPCWAMPFSVTRKAMGGGKNYPPSVGHISEPIQAPIFF